MSSAAQRVSTFVPFGLGLLVGSAACFYLLTQEPHTALSENKSQSDPPPFAISNPSDVFRLRSECEALAQKIVATSLTGDSGVQQEQESHYEPRNGHCYVEVWVHGMDISKWNIRYLYDGQTKQLLAGSGYENGTMMNDIFGSGQNSLSESAGEYIDKMMNRQGPLTRTRWQFLAATNRPS